MRALAKVFVCRGVVYGGLLTVLVAIAGDRGAGLLRAQVGDSTNPVAVENSMTGDADWDLPGANVAPTAGDPSIQGFATDISVNVGTTVHFKIKTDAADYTIKIYRLGYYRGNGARKVATVAPSAQLPQTQPACNPDS